MSESKDTFLSENQKHEIERKALSVSHFVVGDFCILLAVLATFLGDHKLIPVAACSIYTLSIAVKNWYFSIKLKKIRFTVYAVLSTAAFVLFCFLLLRTLVPAL